MDHKYQRLKGRPALQKGKKTKKIDVRFTPEEYLLISQMETTLGISKTELIRIRVLKQSSNLVLNAQEMIKTLDQTGTELARAGNNINQLARYANTLNKRGMLSAQLIERFNILFDQHIQVQLKLEVTLRKIIRQMGK